MKKLKRDDGFKAIVEKVEKKFEAEKNSKSQLKEFEKLKAEKLKSKL